MMPCDGNISEERIATNAKTCAKTTWLFSETSLIIEPGFSYKNAVINEV